MYNQCVTYQSVKHKKQSKSQRKYQASHTAQSPEQKTTRAGVSLAHSTT